MTVQMLIYVYMSICVSLMVFNAFYAIIMKQVNKSIEMNTDIYEKEISNQVDRVQNGLNITEQHRKFLYKKLKKISHLTAFDKSLESIYAERHDDTTKYLLQIYPVFMYLSTEYGKKDRVKTAYLPYVISKYNLLKLKNTKFILDLVLDLLHSENVYCRENALKAIYSMGDSDCVVKALKIINSGEHFHHPKLITDGLMTFNGDTKELAEKLWNDFDVFSLTMQTNILNFIRFAGIRNDEAMLEVICSEGSNKEIRFAAMRYFEKFYCPTAEEILHKFAKNEEGYSWEYQAIASSALKSYPGKETEKILKNNLGNPNWYVRYNSAESCEKLGLSYSDLITVFNGGDRYAREMAQYRFDRKAAQKEVVMN